MRWRMYLVAVVKLDRRHVEMFECDGALALALAVDVMLGSLVVVRRPVRSVLRDRVQQIGAGAD